MTENKTKQFTRARSDEAKELRRAAILTAAASLFEAQNYESLTVDAIAAACGLAKGTVYLYFGSKEAIFLELLVRELRSWFAALEAPLEELVPGDERGVAEVLACSLGERRTLRRLLSLLHQTLEQNIDQETARSFKLELLGAMGPPAKLLERCLPSFDPGDGFRFIIHLHALTIGVGQMSEASAVVEAVLAEPDLAGFRVSFVNELHAILVLILRGWNAAPPSEHERVRDPD